MSLVEDDATLVAAAQAGNREAWSGLVHRHARRLAAYVGSRVRRPKLVEKLVEDSLVAAYRHLHELEDPREFAGWLRRIGANLALRWHREHPEEKLVEPFPAELCAGDQALAARLQRIEDGLGGMTDAQRMALESRYRGGLSGAVLAESLHLDPLAAQRLVDQALGELDRQLGSGPTL